MYGDCQVLMSSSSSMGGGGGVRDSTMGLTVPEDHNNMIMSSSSSDHHHHNNRNPFQPHGFFPSPLLDRNPNPHHNNNMSFNFMSPVTSMPSFHPFPSLIPKDEMLGTGMMLGLRRGGGGGSGKDEMDSNISGGSTEHMHELDTGGGNTLNELEISNHLLDHHHHHSDDPQQQVSGLLTAGGTGGPPNKKKRYHRHTAHQIQELEAMFKECPHPDDKQRMKLSQELGLKPRQVKFWFQNRRTQMKAQQDRSDNVILRAENEGLKTENYRLQALMRSLMCPNCGNSTIFGEVAYDEQQLRLENNRLKEELDRLCNMTSRYGGGRQLPPPSLCSPSPSSSLLPPSLDLDMNIYSRHHFQDPHSTTLPLPPPPHSDHHQHHQAMLGSSGPQHIPLLPPDHHHNNHPHSLHQSSGSTSPFPQGGIVLEEEKPMAMELAVSSLEEVIKMCQVNEPLWVNSSGNENSEVMNGEEYSRMFPYWGVEKQHSECCRREATRHSALVIMNSVNLVDAFVDANKWIELFPSLVSRAKTIQIVASGVPGHASGSLHLMYAEFQVLTPLVPTREAHFLRYCHHNAEDGIWSIVDFPIDNFHCSGVLQMSHPPRYRRRPSGCIIQDMPNGYSKVTWVEHAEILEEKPVPQIFNKYVTSGMAYGAQRWLAVLQRQCERVASQMARNICDVGVIQSPECRKNLMRLSQRMIRTFCTNMSTAGGQSWTTVADSSEPTLRITVRQVTEPGQPNGVILSAASTTWLPFPHDQVFNFLKNEHKRSQQLDALSNGNSLHEVAHIANGSDPGNCISLLRINVASNSSQNVDLMLQESCTDSSGSLIVYTTVEVNYIQLVMSGEDPSCIPLLPLGFSIIPHTMDSTTTAAAVHSSSPSNTPPDHHSNINTTEGCLLTVGLQVHASTMPTHKLNLSSVKLINNHLCNAVQQINVALMATTTTTSSPTTATTPSNFAPPVHHHHHQSSPSMPDDRTTSPAAHK